MTDKIRASYLSGYSDCARRSAARLFRREIEGLGYDLAPDQKGIGSAIGTSVHAAAALTLREKMATGSLAPLSAVTDCAVETFGAEREAGITFDQASPNSHDAEAQVVRMAAAYQRVIAPGIDPVVVEERLEADTSFGLTVSGQGDVLAREAGRLRDLKTGKNRGNHKPQLGAYSLIYKAHGHDVRECAEDFLPRAPLKKPQPDPQSFGHDLEAAETAALNVLRHIASDLHTFRHGDDKRGILAGDPWAFVANPSSMLCGPKYCPAHGTPWCREWREKE